MLRWLLALLVSVICGCQDAGWTRALCHTLRVCAVRSTDHFVKCAQFLVKCAHFFVKCSHDGGSVLRSPLACRCRHSNCMQMATNSVL